MRKELKMVVAGTNANGEPDLFFFILVDVFNHEIHNEVHYSYAEAIAESEGYERPFVVFDELDRCAPSLFKLFEWNTASKYTGIKELDTVRTRNKFFKD